MDCIAEEDSPSSTHDENISLPKTKASSPSKSLFRRFSVNRKSALTSRVDISGPIEGTFRHIDRSSQSSARFAPEGISSPKGSLEQEGKLSRLNSLRRRFSLVKRSKPNSAEPIQTPKQKYTQMIFNLKTESSDLVEWVRQHSDTAGATDALASILPFEDTTVIESLLAQSHGDVTLAVTLHMWSRHRKVPIQV